MSELCKCLRCGRVLIDEEFEGHKCKIKINGKITVVEAVHWIVGKHPDSGEEMISAKALDGTTYWIVKRPSKASDKAPFNPSDELLQGEKRQPSDENDTEP